jgi:hypothetical protein
VPLRGRVPRLHYARGLDHCAPGPGRLGTGLLYSKRSDGEDPADSCCARPRNYGLSPTTRTPAVSRRCRLSHTYVTNTLHRVQLPKQESEDFLFCAFY